MLEISTLILTLLFGGFNLHNWRANVQHSVVKAAIYRSRVFGGYFALLFFIAFLFVIYGFFLNWKMGLFLFIAGLFLAEFTAKIIDYVLVLPIAILLGRGK